ncbi:Protein THEM6 [Seminavis robusta]|uniref:Protein THEM6 n=1 Tax=Seminavis robusta TaxID=568900 RepID=A0A9N8DDB0_9STRA|nr:Protein THEM6 [Seminavis robusta]|eukprot:Sro67_g037420.1 Protein THEM6 (196) ;mRNA; f:10360-11037
MIPTRVLLESERRILSFRILRAGLFDCDYMLHLNNAAYLTHSEYARWELCAYNGLMESMYKDKVNFVVGGTAIRYRREIRPVFRQFEVHTFVAHVDERHFWIYHTFRYPPGGSDPGRIRCQMVCQGLAIQGRTVMDPRKYLVENVGIDAELIDELLQAESSNTTMHDLMDKYLAMDEKFKEASAKDDEWIAKKNE